MTYSQVHFPAHAWQKFKRGIEYLVEEPRRLYMSEWVTKLDAPDDFNERRSVLDTLIKRQHGSTPPCGTTCCLAGAFILGNAVLSAQDITDVSITYSESAWGPVSFTETALSTLGIDPFTDDNVVLGRLMSIFYRSDIESVLGLLAALEQEFIFPEPLPHPSVMTLADVRWLAAVDDLPLGWETQFRRKFEGVGPFPADEVYAWIERFEAWL